MIKNKPFWFSLSLVAVYLLLGYFAVPRIMQPVLEDHVFLVTGRQLQFENIRVDPITLSFELSNLELREGDESLWPGLSMRFETVHARFNFWRMTPVVSELHFGRPVFELATDFLPEGIESARPAKNYPFVSLWKKWMEKQPGAAKLLPYPVERWRVDAGQLLVGTGQAQGAASVLLTDVQLLASQAEQGRQTDFELDMELSGGELVRLRGMLDADQQNTTGTFELPQFQLNSWLPGAGTQDAASRGLAGSPLLGAFETSLFAEGLKLELFDVAFQASAFSTCALEQLLCAEFQPLALQFNATLLLASSGVLLEKAHGQAGPFSLDASLGGGQLELARHHIGSAIFELGPVSKPGVGIAPYEAGSAAAMTREFILDLSLGESREMQGKGQFNHRFGSAEARFAMTGDLPVHGEVGLQQFAQQHMDQQEIKPAWSQLAIKLENPNAGLARHFADKYLAGRLASDSLQLDMAVRWERDQLYLHESILLEQASLVPGTASTDAPVLDPGWLLALLQDPEGRVVLQPFSGETLAADKQSLGESREQSLVSGLNTLLEDPLLALSSVLGQADPNMGEVRFEAGSAALDEGSAGKLALLGEALNHRPGLSVQIAGVLDPLIDRKALQAEQVSTHVALATAADLAFQSGSQLPDFSDPKVHSVIDEFARRRLPPQVLASFSEHFGMADVDQGLKPEGDADAYYAALFEILVDYAQIPQGALTTLARYRAQAVVDELARAGVSKDRLLVEKQAMDTEARVDGIPLPVRLQLNPGDGIAEPGAPAMEAGPGLPDTD